MAGSSFESHLDFYMPPCGVCSTQALKFPPELLKIFYIARVIFSEASTHRIKTQAAPLFNRDHVFISRSSKTEDQTSVQQKAPMDNFINLAKMTALRDIARLLPREHIIYADTIFYKKLANRELIKIDYEGYSEGTTSANNFLRQKETELKRSQKIYLLFDNSTSMNGEKFKKLFVAKAIAIEYLRRVSAERPQIYFRTFHSEFGGLVKASTEETIHMLIQHITRVQTGGGRITNIGDAIVQAIEDITSDPEMEEAEILVMTDGFGPIPRDIKERLGNITLHVILIPDLDIEKILVLYPDRKAWEQGGPDGRRPMPDFWKYYSSEAPPTFLHGDEMYQSSVRSYRTASKSVTDQKALEILQGLNQVYMLQDVCKNFIFIVITSILGDKFAFSLSDLEAIEANIQALQEKTIAGMTNDEKLQFLQTVNFMLQFLLVANSNSKDKAVKDKMRLLRKALEVLQARILDDPWIRTMLKVDDIKINVKFDLAGSKEENKLSFFEAIAYLLKFFWDTIHDSMKLIWKDYKI